MPSEFRQRTEEEVVASLQTAVTVHRSGRHLVRFLAPEEPYFPLVDTNWALLHRLDYAETEIFLRNRAAKGFTAVMVVLVVQHGLFDYPDRQGEWMFHPDSRPLTDDGELRAMDQGADKYRPDLSRPNPKFWAHVDRVVKLAADLGISVNFLPTWARWVNGGYWGRPILFSEDTAFQYGKFLGERYPFHPFIIGGDGNRYWNPDIKTLLQSGTPPNDIEVVDFGRVFERMAQGVLEGERQGIAKLSSKVKEMANGYQTFMTFHPAQPWLPRAPEALASSEWPDADWLCLDACQTGHHDGAGDTDIKTEKEGASKAQSGAVEMPMWRCRSSYIPIRKMYAARTKDGSPRPCMDLEPHYEMIHPGFDWSTPYWNGDDVRNGALQAIFAGACGYTYGCCSMIQFHNDQSLTHKPILPPCTSYTNWFHELDVPGSFYAASIRKIMLALPAFFSRIPDQSFITSDTHDVEPAGDRLIGGMRGNGWAMVHLPYGGPVTVDIAKALPGAAKWNAWWIDPKTGGRLPPFLSCQTTTSTMTFDAPSAGSLKDDWLLYIDTPSSVDMWPNGVETALGIWGV